MSRGRIGLLVALLCVCFGVSGGYLLHERRIALVEEAAIPDHPEQAPADASTLLRSPRIVFRDTTPGAGYSTLAVVSLADPGGARAGLSLRCERVYASARAGVCLRARRSLVPSYELVTLDEDLRPRSAAPLTGLPSRARTSRDGSLVSTTVFLTGHSYGSAAFSTETVIRKDGHGQGNLESWRTTLPDGSTLSRADRNFWGVTFASDDDTFYATAASGATTWLVRGSVSRRTMTALRTDAECPSLSPAGTEVAYKKRLDGAPGVWRLAVLDLASGRETLLSETRSVDDQVEWLDDDRLLYAVPRDGSDSGAADVWVDAADGGGSPAVLIAGATSPAVVRP